MHHRCLAATALALALLAGGPPARAVPVQQGVSYSAWNKDLTDPGLAAEWDASVQRMSSHGVNWVAVNVFEFQDDLAATTIYPDTGWWSTDPASVEAAVNALHAQGKRVLLKPVVDVKSGGWRAQIPGSDPWFDEYETFIERWAQRADTWGCEGFSVGTELTATQGNTARWTGVVNTAKAQFTDPEAVNFTYAANFDSLLYPAWPNYNPVDWWDQVDFIGIDAYFPLTNQHDPTLAQLQAAWEGYADDIEDWLLNDLADDDRLPVLFTEIGYAIWDGTNRWPWDMYYTDPGGTRHTDGTGVMDLAEQADCTLAALAETWDRDWMAGYYWWIWDTLPGGEDHNKYRFQTHEAAWVVRRFYVPEPGSVALAGLGLLGLARRRRARRCR